MAVVCCGVRGRKKENCDLEGGLWGQTARAPMILLALSRVSFVLGFLSENPLSRDCCDTV